MLSSLVKYGLLLVYLFFVSVIYNFNHGGSHSLQLNVGENVYILRQSEGWWIDNFLVVWTDTLDGIVCQKTFISQ